MKNQSPSDRAPYFWVPSLYLAQGLPFFAVMFLANVMLQARGVALDQITHWTAAIGVTWVLKPLWSPFIELASNKKKVVVFFELAGGAALGMVAVALQTPFWFAASIAMLGLVAIFSSTHDIACDGLYIASLDEKGQAQYAGWTGTFFNAGRVIAAGGLVSLAGAIANASDVLTAWTAIYGLLGVMMLTLGLYNLWVLPSGRNAAKTDISANAIAAALVEVIIEFFKKPGILICVLFIVLFRAGEAQVQTIGPLFLRASRASGGLGLDLVQLGAVYGSAGTVAFIVGSIGGGYFTARLGLKRAILPLILAVNLPNIVFYLLALYQPTDLLIIGSGLAVEMFGYGFGFVGLILYMMQVVAPGKYQTAHYAIATGIMHLGFTLFKFFSGDVQMALGFQHFFLWVLACGVPVAVMSQLISMSARQSNPEQAIAPAAAS
jgi:PAT family beta-lactamase induction signal transducer AmpG